jgi:hypothetical protein
MEHIFEPFSFLTLQLPMKDDITVTSEILSPSTPITSVTIVTPSSIQEEHITEGRRITKKELKEQLSSKLVVPKSKVLIVEVNNHKIARVFSDKERLPNKVHAYILYEAKQEKSHIIVNLLEKGKVFTDPMIFSLPKHVDVTHALVEELRPIMAVKQTITHGSSEAFYDEGSHSRRTAATPQRPLKRDEYSAVAGTHTHPVVFETDREALCTDAYAPAPSSFKRKLEEKSETVVPLVSLDSGNIPGWSFPLANDH